MITSGALAGSLVVEHVAAAVSQSTPVHTSDLTAGRASVGTARLELDVGGGAGRFPVDVNRLPVLARPGAARHTEATRSQDPTRWWTGRWRAPRPVTRCRSATRRTTAPGPGPKRRNRLWRVLRKPTFCWSRSKVCGWQPGCRGTRQRPVPYPDPAFTEAGVEDPDGNSRFPLRDCHRTTRRLGVGTGDEAGTGPTALDDLALVHHRRQLRRYRSRSCPPGSCRRRRNGASRCPRSARCAAAARAGCRGLRR